MLLHCQAVVRLIMQQEGGGWRVEGVADIIKCCLTYLQVQWASDNSVNWCSTFIILRWSCSAMIPNQYLMFSKLFLKTIFILSNVVSCSSKPLEEESVSLISDSKMYSTQIQDNSVPAEDSFRYNCSASSLFRFFKNLILKQGYKLTENIWISIELYYRQLKIEGKHRNLDLP